MLLFTDFIKHIKLLKDLKCTDVDGHIEIEKVTGKKPRYEKFMLPSLVYENGNYKQRMSYRGNFLIEKLYPTQNDVKALKIVRLMETYEQWKDKSLIALYFPEEDKYYLQDGHHRFIALSLLNVKEHPVNYITYKS